jgi:hypothetical protein
MEFNNLDNFEYQEYHTLFSRFENINFLSRNNQMRRKKRRGQQEQRSHTNESQGTRMQIKKLESYLCFLLIKPAIYREKRNPSQYICLRLGTPGLEAKVNTLIEEVTLAIEDDLERIPGYGPVESHEIDFCGVCNTYFGKVAGHFCDRNNIRTRYEIPDYIDEEDRPLYIDSKTEDDPIFIQEVIENFFNVIKPALEKHYQGKGICERVRNSRAFRISRNVILTFSG